LVKGIREIQIGESTLWYLQSVKLFFTGYLRETVEWGVQEVKGLGFGILNLSGLSLYHCTQYFSIVKMKTGSRPVDVGILPNHVNYLCTCVIDVCSPVLYFQTCLSHKGLVGNWLPIKLPIFPTIGIKAWLRISTCCGEMQSTECRGIVHGRSMEHYSRAEVLFTDGVRSTVHKQRYCSWRTIHGVLFTSHCSRSAR
jgi:hypothetical protein